MLILISNDVLTLTTISNAAHLTNASRSVMIPDLGFETRVVWKWYKTKIITKKCFYLFETRVVWKWYKTNNIIKYVSMAFETRVVLDRSHGNTIPKFYTQII